MLSSVQLPNELSLAETRSQTRAILDLTMRLGEVIFAAGAGAEDATAAMHAVARAYGLERTEADVTHTLLTLTYENRSTHESISRSRNVKYRTLNYSQLTRTSLLIGELIRHPLPVPEARLKLAEIVRTRSPVSRFWRRIGWSLLGAGAAILIGGGPVVIVAAFVATFFVDLLTETLARHKVPVFYQAVAGGAIGPIVAALVQVIDPSASSSKVIVATIIMLLAGVTTFGAVHDILSGFYVTGSARGAEAVVITMGLVTGVAGSALLLSRMGFTLSTDMATPTLENLPLLLVAAVVIVAGFSLAVQMPWRAFWLVAVLGALAELLYFLGVSAGFGPIWSSAVSAFGVGLVAGIASRIVRTPPLVIVVAALVPLVPGLVLFRSLLQLFEGDINGLLGMLTAAAVAGALAAGAILAQYLVQSIWGPARRLQRRFIGPVMALQVSLHRRKSIRPEDSL
ncbi:threonine/serine exporter ThrE family protein [Homoserinimonas sp. OAct 916]|uniref:threonine/serine ThrE exporter family protein n=1 Tax=Homoserinimonas sp. OAct 916 TaxID=2211450 RepID=UPI0018E53AE7|nr:threonine/serine exporter family protein [Homoserinimonas sp. OAct 916]